MFRNVYSELVSVQVHLRSRFSLHQLLFFLRIFHLISHLLYRIWLRYLHFGLICFKITLSFETEFFSSVAVCHACKPKGICNSFSCILVHKFKQFLINKYLDRILWDLNFREKKASICFFIWFMFVRCSNGTLRFVEITNKYIFRLFLDLCIIMYASELNRPLFTIPDTCSKK